MKQFFKDNLVIISGILLPLMLALVFFAATKANTIGIEPPKTSVVFSANDYQYNNNLWQLSVRDGLVYVRYAAPPKPDPNNPNIHPYYTNNRPDLHLFDPVTGKDRQIALPEFGPDETGEKVVTDLGDIKLDTSANSPDGYVFENDSYRDSNLMTELFGGGHGYRATYVLRKGGKRVPVPNAPYYNARFVGWVMP